MAKRSSIFDIAATDQLSSEPRADKVLEISSWEPGLPGLAATRKLLGSTGGILALFIVVILAVLLGRLAYLQGWRGDYYRQRAEQNRIRTLTVPAPRGSIEDYSGRPLVENTPNFSLLVVPADLPETPAERAVVIEQLHQWSGRSRPDIDQAIQPKRQRRTDPVTIVEHATYDQAILWSLTAPTLPGVSIVAQPTRSYLHGPAMASFMGYIGLVSPEELATNRHLSSQTLTGKQGIERMYQDDLMGVNGQRDIERDAYNQPQRILNEREAVPGKTLRLSIDRDLQIDLYREVVKAVKNHGQSGGAAVAIDPRNGHVLAMVSVPSYDNNWFVSPGHQPEITRVLTDPGRPLLNRAIAGQYPSGSIIKPLIGVAAMAEQVITATTTIVSTGGFRVGPNNFPDWKAGGHGLTNLSKAIAESVNTYFYAIGGGYQEQAGLGVDRITKYLQAFGWGQTLGIDLLGEAQGLLPLKHWREEQRLTPWRLGDTYHLSIGQGDLSVTPLQVAAAVAAVANGGTLYQPQIVTTFFDAQGRQVREIVPKVLNRNIADQRSFEAVRRAMRQGVEQGSSRSLQSLPVSSGAKTGTAQFGRGGQTHAWHAVFAPYEHPTIALVVIIEQGGEGNVAAVPVTRTVLQRYFSRSAPASQP